MSNTRETKEIEVAGHKLVIKTYLTGRESNEVKAVLFKGIEIEAGAGDKPKVPLANILPQELKTLELLVVSFDGIEQNVVEVIQDLPADAYDAVVAKVKEESKAFLGQTK